MYLTGKAKWVKAVQPDTMYNKWQVVLYPDEPSLVKIRQLQTEGLKNKLRKDDDGYNMNFSRPVTKENRKTGKQMPFSPPLVLNKDGQPYEGARIGNGSDVMLGLDVYSHTVPGSPKGAKAARWVSIRVDNLVPFDKDNDFPDDEKEASVIKDQPQQIF